MSTDWLRKISKAPIQFDVMWDDAPCYGSSQLGLGEALKIIIGGLPRPSCAEWRSNTSSSIK